MGFWGENPTWGRNDLVNGSETNAGRFLLDPPGKAPTDASFFRRGRLYYVHHYN